ncbi:hypothetical protein Bbelb_388350 [Branchiostoma belcheri]|nr:hypothetical protein Bbelb_388350 [Branchiostoma belcheri]
MRFAEIGAPPALSSRIVSTSHRGTASPFPADYRNSQGICEYNTGYRVFRIARGIGPTAGWIARRPQADPTRWRAGTEGDAEYTMLYFIYVIPTQENAPFNAR